MGVIYNGTKYIQLHNEHRLKSLSVEDGVYFTLRDIYLNVHDENEAIEANEFNISLTGNIRFEERGETFEYTDDLYCKHVLTRLCEWISYIVSEDCYEFKTVLAAEVTSIGRHSLNTRLGEFITFGVWREQLQQLLAQLTSRLWAASAPY